MILKPRVSDFKAVGYYLAKIIIALSLTMFIPVILGIAFGEINPCLDFLITIEIGLIIGLILTKLCYTHEDLTWMQGMLVVSVSWVASMVLAAIPLYLSGHWGSYLDACFDAMSGLATTGLALVQDLDHLSHAHNLWRHLIMFVGGQGMVIVAISFLVQGSSGAFKLYVGEAREEKLLPNVIHTARFIWLISLVYLFLGTAILGFIGIRAVGLKPVEAFFHGACIFMAGFDTAGFAPQSQNILYYHSLLYECAVIVIIVLGALNFNFHYQLWFGRRREAWKNIESRAFLISVGLLFFITAIGLSQLGVYSGAVAFFRKGFFQFISGHTTAGYMTIYAQQFIQDWGAFALVGLILAMGVGGCICSTAGGIKMLRLGVIFKGLKEDIKRLVLPEKAVVFEKFHHIKAVFLDDKQVRAAGTITLSYIILYVAGALVAMYYGYPFLESLFESVSASANVGLSCGVTAVNMPAALKVTYIIQMWAGRLEFISIFVLLGVVVALVKGKK